MSPVQKWVSVALIFGTLAAASAIMPPAHAGPGNNNGNGNVGNGNGNGNSGSNNGNNNVGSNNGNNNAGNGNGNGVVGDNQGNGNEKGTSRPAGLKLWNTDSGINDYAVSFCAAWVASHTTGHSANISAARPLKAALPFPCLWWYWPADLISARPR